MKSIYLNFLLIILTIISFPFFAKSQNSKIQLEGILKFNYGLLNHNWNINETLRLNKIPKISNYVYFTGTSISLLHNNICLTTNLNFLYNKTDNAVISNIVKGIKGGALLGYKINVTNDFEFTVGGSYNVTTIDLNIQNKSSIIDINVIDPIYAGNQVGLTSFYSTIGSYLEINFFKKSSFPLGILIDYEIPINKPSWQNSAGQLNNTVLENKPWITFAGFFPLKNWRRNHE